MHTSCNNSYKVLYLRRTLKNRKEIQYRYCTSSVHLPLNTLLSPILPTVYQFLRQLEYRHRFRQTSSKHQCKINSTRRSGFLWSKLPALKRTWDLLPRSLLSHGTYIPQGPQCPRVLEITGVISRRRRPPYCTVMHRCLTGMTGDLEARGGTRQTHTAVVLVENILCLYRIETRKLPFQAFRPLLDSLQDFEKGRRYSRFFNPFFRLTNGKLPVGCLLSIYRYALSRCMPALFYTKGNHW